MGLSWTLTGFPVFVMIICVLMSAASIPAGSAVVIPFNGQGGSNSGTPTVDCTPFLFRLIGGTNACLPALPTVTTLVTCNLTAFNQGPGSGCYILNNCPGGFQNNGGMYCNRLFNIIEQNPGTTVTLNGGQPQPTSTSGFFVGFGNLASGDFTGWILALVAFVIVISITVLGSNVINPESEQIIFQSSIILGFWVFLTGLEGFIQGSPSSFFVQLNSFVPSPYGGFIPFGSIFYTLLSMVLVFGIARAISRTS